MKPAMLQLQSGLQLLRLLLAITLTFYAMIPRVESQPTPDTSKLKIGSVWASVTTDDSDKTVTLRWTAGHQRHTQSLILPPDWTVWTGEESVIYVPSMMSWPISGQNILIVIGTTPSAAYGVRAPFIYRLHHDTWKLVSDPELVWFTNRGGFYVKGRRLYLWDYEMNSTQAHSDPQRYWLTVFSLRRDHLLQTEKRGTPHQHYLGRQDFASGIPPKHLPPKRDPLREFGLRWQWWGWNNSR